MNDIMIDAHSYSVPREGVHLRIYLNHSHKKTSATAEVMIYMVQFNFLYRDLNQTCRFS